MNELFLIAAIPALLVFLSLLCPSLKLIRTASSVFGWAQIVVVFHTIQPVIFGDVPSMIFATGLNLDRIGACFILLTTLVMACCVTHAGYYVQVEEHPKSSASTWNIRLFFGFIQLLQLAMTFVFTCDNLGYLWIGMATTTLSSAPLVYFNGTKNAIEAGRRYLIICSVGIAFALLGTGLICASSQHGGSALAYACTLSSSDLIAHATTLNFPLLRLGLIFCLIGYGTKAGVFPLHTWLPDACAEAAAPISAMLSAILCNCALFGIWRIVQIAHAANPHVSRFGLVTILGALTVVAASLMLVRQHSLKRVWAYSTIENVGIMLVAIGLGSGGMFLLQAITHSLGKAAALLISGNLIQASGCQNSIHLRGILKATPVLKTLLLLSALSVIGSPPFGSFISEFAIIAASANASHWLVSMFLIIGMAISFFAVLTHVGAFLFGTGKLNHGAAFSQPLRAILIPAMLLCCALAFGSIARIDIWMGLR